MSDLNAMPAVPAVTATPKTGLVSSEFLATMVTMAGLIIPGIPDKYLPLTVAVLGIYTAARTVLKAVHVLGYAKQVPDLPAIPDAIASKLPAGSTTTTITTVPK